MTKSSVYFTAGSGPVYPATLTICFLANGTDDLFLPTAATGHQMVSVQKDAVDILAYLAIVAILLDGALLHPPPTRNPVLGTQCQDTLGLLGGQLHVTGATQQDFFPHCLQVTRWPQSRMTQASTSI